MELFEITFLQIIKAFVIFGFIVYLVFAFVVVRQIGLMLSTLDINGFEKPIKYLGYVHLIFAIGVLVISILVL